MGKTFEAAMKSKGIVMLFVAFIVLYFALDNIQWLALFRYEDIFYPLIFGPDWQSIDTDALYDLLDIDEYYYSFIDWGNRLDYAIYISQMAGFGLWMVVGRAKSTLGMKIRELCFSVSAAAAALFTACIYFSTEITGLVCIIGAMFFAASALGLLLWRIAAAIGPKITGMFVVCGMLIKFLIMDLTVRPYFWDGMPPGILTIMITLPLLLLSVFDRPVLRQIASVRGISSGDSDAPIKENLAPDGDSPADSLPIPKSFILTVLAVVFMSFVVSSVAHDQLFAFGDAFWEIEHFGFFLILLTYPVHILGGYLFDKGLRTYGFLIGILCVGVNLAMVLFFEQAQLFGAVWISVIYHLVRDIGGNILIVFCLAAPIYYTALGGRYIPPQTGFFMFALCSFAVPFVFNNTRHDYNVDTIFERQLSITLGIALLLTFAALALVFTLFRLQERHERNIAIAAVKAGTDSDGAEQVTPEDSGIRQKLITSAIEPLTPRELEVAELTVLGIKRKIIADTLFIQSSTVDTHRSSVYSKFGVSTRDELLACLEK